MNLRQAEQDHFESRVGVGNHCNRRLDALQNCGYLGSNKLEINRVQFSILQIRLYPKLSKVAKTYLKILKSGYRFSNTSLSFAPPWFGVS